MSEERATYDASLDRRERIAAALVGVLLPDEFDLDAALARFPEQLPDAVATRRIREQYAPSRTAGPSRFVNPEERRVVVEPAPDEQENN